jgi:ankyrin repeat protein
VPAKANARNHRQESPVYIAALRGHAAALHTLLYQVLQPGASQTAVNSSRGDGEFTGGESAATGGDVAGAAVAPVIPSSVSSPAGSRPSGCGASAAARVHGRSLHPSELLLQPAFLGPDAWTVLHAAVTSAKPDVIGLALAAAMGLLHGDVNPPVGGGDSDDAAHAASSGPNTGLSQAVYTPEEVEAAVARAVEAIGDARGSASSRVGAGNSVLAFLEAQDRHGCSALHYAARNGSADTVRLLLRCGCKRGVKNSLGQTPLAMLRGLKKRPTFRRVPAHDEIDALLGGGR